MKHISIILALSILYYSLGCYRTKVIKQEEEILRQLKIENKVGSGDDQKGLYIKKTDGSRYYLIPQMYIERGDIDNVRIFEGDVVYVYGWNTGTAEDAIDGYIHYNSSKAHWVVRAELFEIPVALLKREQIKVVGHKFQKEDWRI